MAYRARELQGRGVVVSDYRVYRLNTDGRILRGDYLFADSDAGAIKAVRDQAHETDCEIWLGNRKIAVVPAGGGEPVLHTDKM